MLEKQEPDARPEHPAQFAQRPRLVVHPAQHQRGDHASNVPSSNGRSWAGVRTTWAWSPTLRCRWRKVGEFRVEPGCAIVLATLCLGPAAALVSERRVKAGLWPGPWAAWT